MEDLEKLNVNTTAFAIFLLLLSVLGIFWTVSCSWLDGRKKRQRVGSAANDEDLVLQITKTCPDGKTTNRHSLAGQIIILPTDYLRQNLQVPTIVVTPPSPQGTAGEISSLRSDSSIGSAEDPFQEDQDAVSAFCDKTEAESGLIKRDYIQDKIENVLPSGTSNSNEDKGELLLPKDKPEAVESHVKEAIEDVAFSRKGGNDVIDCQGHVNSPAVIIISGCQISKIIDNDDDFCDQSTHRPVVSSVEPATKREDFQLRNGSSW